MKKTSLFLIRLRFTWFQLVEFLKVLSRYYRKPSFARADLLLLAQYLFQNPFRIHRRFLQKRGERELYTYGETPLTTLEQIARAFEIRPSDLVYEFGCGRGRSCFWLNQQIGCRVVGIEQLPLFIKRAERVRRLLDFKGIKFILGDYRSVDLSEASVVYLYGSDLSNEEVEEVSRALQALKPGSKAITVSYPLSSESFELVSSLSAPFGWGEAEVFLQVKR